MKIEHTIFTQSNTILSDQNACLLSYNIMEKGLVKILLDQDDRAKKFFPIICVFTWSYDQWSVLWMTLILYQTYLYWHFVSLFCHIWLVEPWPFRRNFLLDKIYCHWIQNSTKFRTKEVFFNVLFQERLSSQAYITLNKCWEFYTGTSALLPRISYWDYQ